MSKTAQRKRQAYEEGLRHGSIGGGIAYSRHPFMEHYRRGYYDGAARAEAARERKSIGARLLIWLSGKFA
jgi:hypothetical protein